MMTSQGRACVRGPVAGHAADTCTIIFHVFPAVRGLAHLHCLISCVREERRWQTAAAREDAASIMDCFDGVILHRVPDPRQRCLRGIVLE